MVTTNLTTNALRSTPTYANGVVYVGAGIYTYLVTAGGSVIGHIPAASEFGGTVVDDGAVYVLDFNDFQLVKYDLGVGTLARPLPGSLHRA